MATSTPAPPQADPGSAPLYIIQPSDPLFAKSAVALPVKSYNIEVVADAWPPPKENRPVAVRSAPTSAIGREDERLTFSDRVNIFNIIIKVPCEAWYAIDKDTL